MLFCEKCNIVTAENHCPLCGNKKIRTVCDTDFCFFANLSEFDFTIWENALKEKAIDMVSVPFYSHGVTYCNAGRAEERKAYIRYKDTEQAKEIYELLFGYTDQNCQ